MRRVVGVRVCVVRGHRDLHRVVGQRNQVLGHRGEVQRHPGQVVVAPG